jgi:hypothetical protein
MRAKGRLLRALFTLALMVMLPPRCTITPIDAGGGHDGDARVAMVMGTIVDAHDQGVPGLQVLLLPSDFDPARHCLPTCGSRVAAWCSISTPE